MGPTSHEKNKHKKWYRKIFNVEKLDKKYQSEFTINHTLQLAAFGILVVFIGLRRGMGLAIKSLMDNQTPKYEHHILFKDGEKPNVTILGQNNLYLCYVEKVDTYLTISPIEENIKKIIPLESIE